MRTFRQDLTEKLQDKDFRIAYEEEKQLLAMALRIAEARKKNGYSQKELAKKAHVTTDQLSRIERGMNCNMLSFIKVCHALDMTLNMAR